MMEYSTSRLWIIIIGGWLGWLCLSQQVLASAFQVWEQDGASIANYHAGYAAEANDASIAFTNPAGIPRIKNQQIIFGADGVVTDIQYRGTVAVNTAINSNPQPVTAQGGLFTPIPFLQYVAPITDTLGFGLSVVVPFGAQINYRRTTFLEYVSTYTSVKVIDMTPTLGWQVTDKASIGAGPDVQKMSVEFDQIAILGDSSSDTSSTNRADDTAWGYHLGGLYQFNENSRIGLSYHSQVVHHLSRRSSFSGPLADVINDNQPLISRATANITLPPYTALSVFHHVNSTFTVMGSVVYTQWCTVRNLVMKNLAGIDTGNPTTNLEVVVPQNFRNTWNVSLGGDYHVTDTIILKAGLGYDETPVQNEYRNVQLPDNDRYVAALGGHYQASKAIGVDLGWNHVFIHKAHVSPPTQITGDQQAVTNGSVTGGADVYAAQITWDIV